MTRTSSAAPLSIVCLGEVPWDRSWKRNQSMVYELSALPPFDRVVFVDPRPFRLAVELRGLGGGPARSLRRLRGVIPRRVRGRVWLLGLLQTLPWVDRFPAGARLEEWLLEQTIRALRGRRPYLLLNNHPDFFAPALLQRLMDGAVLSIFDLSDDFVEFYAKELPRRRYLDNIERCCRRSDLVLAINDYVREKYGHLNARTTVLHNATNFENFHRSAYRKVSFMETIRRLGGPILGHTGTINRVRLDYGLLERLLVARPDWQFVFVGSAEPSFLELVPRHANLHYHAAVPYERLPDYVQYFDAAVIPFQVNEHTLGNDLLKFNDYLAMAKPIVTTPTGGAERFAELVWIADGEGPFLAACEAALREPADHPLRERRRAVARENSWPKRVRELHELILERLRANERQPPC